LTGGGVNHTAATRWAATGTGKVQKIRFYAAANTNAKVGIYTDAAGLPGTRIGVQNASTPVIGGQWNDIDLSAECEVTNNTLYWLVVLQSAANTVKYDNEVGRSYKFSYTKTFAEGLPENGGDMSWTDYSGIYISYSAYGILVLTPSSISQLVSYGSPKLNLSIKPSSILQALVYGTPTVLTSALIIQPSSILQVVAIGTPSLRYRQTISPSSIIQSISVGMPWVGILGLIKPQSTIQPVAIGTPTLLKYVWHVILDGNYATETPEKNRMFVIGRDRYGNPVWGEAQDSTEIGLVGERLDFQPDPAIPTTAQAADVASAVLSKIRLMGKRGVILIPPNCGQELFDVVQISDSGANQSAVKFRVVGIRFEYSPKQARYQHKLILGAT